MHETMIKENVVPEAGKNILEQVTFFTISYSSKIKIHLVNVWGDQVGHPPGKNQVPIAQYSEQSGNFSYMFYFHTTFGMP